MTGRRHDSTRRTAWARAGLAGTAALAIGAATLIGGADTGAAEGRGHTGLERDTRALRDTGATAVVSATSDAAGRVQRARAGVTDLDDPQPLAYDSYYRVGSDAKTFTAAVVLQLVGEGRLSLGDTVERWLPGVVTGNGNDGSRVTVRDLLQHTSGITNYTDVLYADPEDLTPEAYLADRFRGLTPREQVALAMSRAPGWLPTPGQTRWAYSNTNYVLAGMIIEEATGNPWAQEIHERIIGPLGLRHTLTPGTSAYVPEPTATAYLQFPGHDELIDTTLMVDGGADGGVISTAEDMTAFHRALMDGTLLGPGELAELRRTVPAPGFSAVPGTRYGLGIAWRPARGCPDGLWFHGGTSFGTASEGAVTDDGRAAVAAGIYTLSFADQQAQEARNAAARRLTDRALCGAR
ncbi:serine hydrolase domain-containing protein [Streptomyces avicenniae]|uniref:serine hydrolase domain-containing protein n=1 Tax=Streptomyces avicenniae TaxID=500153 RepID=UPI00069935D6|nr:serine hydrolase domain-containing protein [Streptomyces avicenniae]